MKSCLIKKLGTYIVLSICFPYFTFGMNNPDPVDHKTVRKIVTTHISSHPTLLDSSKNKDIVVFLGNTGAGKSTLINYLNDKKLTVDTLGDIALADPGDTSAMAIGGGTNSETFLPAFIQSGNFLLYDLPGFKDTRGTATSLVNACFIKSIIENAKSVKLVFVAGIDQITSDRGSSFKKLLSQAKQLIPNSKPPIESFSSLVITKSHINKAGLPGFVKAKVDLSNPDFEILEYLIDGQIVAQMSRPINSTITPQDKDDILKIISNINPAKIDNIDTGVVYDTTQQFEIGKIYDAEIEDIIEKLISQNIDIQNLSSLDKVNLENKKDNMINNFHSQVISSLDGSSLIKLLRPISEALYKTAWNNKSKTLTIRVDSIVSQINTEIKEKEKQEEAQKRLQAEAALRHEQERTRAAQEQAYRVEQELRVYKEREEMQIQAEIQRKKVEESERNRQEYRTERERAYQEEARRQSEKKRLEEESNKRNLLDQNVCGRGGVHDWKGGGESSATLNLDTGNHYNWIYEYQKCTRCGSKIRTYPWPPKS